MADNKNFNIIIVGDLLPAKENAVDFESANVKALFDDRLCGLFADADFSIANLEGPLTDCSQSQEKIGPVLKARKATANGIKALGITAVALANNHVTDYGQQGMQDTLDTLDSYGIAHVGAGLNISCINTHISMQYGGGNICIYNVSETFFNVPTATSAGVNLYDEYCVCNEIRELKAHHDYLIVIYHGGAEYFPYPTPQTRRRFHRMADCGADFITAQHTHCIGCEEYYNGAYLLYGQGNFSFARQHSKPCTKEGLVIEIRLSSEVEIIKHHVHQESDRSIALSDNWDDNAFKKRGTKIEDEAFIQSEFAALKPDNIVDRYLLAYKGKAFFAAKFRKLIPKRQFRKIIEAYTKEQIMRNQFTLSSDRASEDIYYMWKNISNKNKIN